jgi:hypothetical protein
MSQKEIHTLEFHWPVQMAAERGNLGIVTFKHDGGEEGASGRAISVTD